MPSATFVAENSTYIENLMRHRFIYDISSLLLRQSPPELLTVLMSEVDNSGIDLVMTFRKVTRQIQMKTLAKAITPNPYSIAESLGGIVGGCVIWICYDRDTLEPIRYHLMGGRGNAPMRDLTSFSQATKKKNGVKIARRGYRSIKIRDAEHQNIILQDLVEVLFDIVIPIKLSN